MHLKSQIIRAGTIPRTTNQTLKFEGQKYGLPYSYFNVQNKRGEGPPLHTHKYAEQWHVLKGHGLMTIGEEVFEVFADDIGIVAPGVPHKFKNIGYGVLHIQCMHCWPVIEQVELE